MSTDKIDLNAKSSSELRELKAQVDQAIEAKLEKEVDEVREYVKGKAAELGVTIEQILGGKGRKGKKHTTPKYRNPKNPEQVWSGRGRRPVWVNEHLEGGGSPEDLEIQNS